MGAGRVVRELLKWLFEQLFQNSLHWLVDQIGSAGEVALFLLVGLSLLVGGPLYMSRDNKRRIATERRPRYGWIEYAIIMTGGLVFTAVGIALIATAE